MQFSDQTEMRRILSGHPVDSSVMSTTEGIDMGDEQAAQDLARREEEMKTRASVLQSRLRNLERYHARMSEGELDIALRSCRYELYQLTADAINGEWTADDVAAWCERAALLGARHPQLRWTLLLDLVHVRKVPNTPFRERFENALASGAIAHHLVTLVHRHLVDVERERGENFGSSNLICGRHTQTRILERWLGMQTVAWDRKHKALRLFIPYEHALALSRALDMDPHTAGI